MRHPETKAIYFNTDILGTPRSSTTTTSRPGWEIWRTSSSTDNRNNKSAPQIRTLTSTRDQPKPPNLTTGNPKTNTNSICTRNATSTREELSIAGSALGRRGKGECFFYNGRRTVIRLLIIVFFPQRLVCFEISPQLTFSCYPSELVPLCCEEVKRVSL